MGTAVCPVMGCRITVDVVLKSSDGALIGSHKANLDSFGDAFPSARNGPIDMSEIQGTVKALMHYIHPGSHLDVSRLTSRELFSLAYAGEKYKVSDAMTACSRYIMGLVEKYPVRSLGYAVKFNYPKIADAAAPWTVFRDPATMKKVLKDAQGLCAWLEYKMDFIGKLCRQLSISVEAQTGVVDLSQCPAWDKYHSSVLAKFSDMVQGGPSPRQTEKHGDIFDPDIAACPRWNCPCKTAGGGRLNLEDVKRMWRDRILDEMEEEEPVFTTKYLRRSD